jgi:hypothetical protein
MIKPLIDRIQLDEQTGCWNWRGARTLKGYGQASFMGIKTTAHRLSAYLWLRHPLKDKKLILHKCDNPSCFNPKHLFIGTYLENSLDMVRKGRHYKGDLNLNKTHCPKGHLYAGENLAVIKRSGTQRTYRRCMTCRREQDKLLKREMRRNAFNPS